jgi:hypothetical protein
MQEETLSLRLTEADVTKAVDKAIEYSAKFGFQKYDEEKNARMASDVITNPPQALAHPEFDGLPILPTEFAIARATAN